MRISGVLREVFHGLRHLGDRGYTYFEVLGDSAGLSSRLTFAERRFFLSLRAILRNSGMIVYDIGAATGVFSSCMAKSRNVTKVYAFEPIPDVFSELKENMRPFRNVECHNIALGDTNGRAPMFVNDFVYSSSLLPMAKLHKDEFPFTRDEHVEEISVARLDDFVRENGLSLPDFVKVDVQGFEDRVLRGGERVIRQARWCMLEMSFYRLYEGALLFDELHAVMRNFGFRLTDLSGEPTGRSARRLSVDGLYVNEQSPTVDVDSGTSSSSTRLR